MLSLHTNHLSLIVQNSMHQSTGGMSQAMQRLSTGLRVNSAADDAAGLQIATRLQSQVNGLSVASRNTQDAISLLQTAEGALDEMTNIGQRMRDLALLAANGTNSESETKAMQSEWDALCYELKNIMDNTQYGSGSSVFGEYDHNARELVDDSGIFSQATYFQIGATSNEQMEVDLVDKIDSIFSTIGRWDWPDDDDIVWIKSGLFGYSLTLDASSAVYGIDRLLDQVGELRSELGAKINRLEHTTLNLANMSENTTMAKGRILDTYYAVESSEMMKNQLLTQASMSMLTQSNAMSNLVMNFLS
ncbi:flagellin [Vibrio sp. WXL210]|uniref:flagellin N-terminal helical domain-containing protein n=1 Tax=Vibrio sp. WXL210 TaxID=3450709 RepID=UPI003EC4C586